jgi:hypothetical protein
MNSDNDWTNDTCKFFGKYNFVHQIFFSDIEILNESMKNINVLSEHQFLNMHFE